MPDGTIPSSVPYFRSNLIFDWQQENATFTEALNYSLNITPPIVPPIVFQSGQLKGQSYQPGQYMQIEGFDQLKFNQYNALSDLPW